MAGIKIDDPDTQAIIEHYAKLSGEALAKHIDQQIFERILADQGLSLKELKPEDISEDRWKQIVGEMYEEINNTGRDPKV